MHVSTFEDTYRHDELMSASDRFESILLDELVRNVLSECVASASWRDAPTCAVIGVRPKQVAHGSLVWNLHHTIDAFDLVKGVQRWRKTAVQTEDLVFDHSAQGQVIEEVGQELPHIRVPVLAHALVVEAVNLSDLAAFMVPSQNGDSVLIPHLQANQ